jgi:peptide-methionine (S)-S-oxide reductase
MALNQRTGDTRLHPLPAQSPSLSSGAPLKCLYASSNIITNEMTEQQRASSSPSETAILGGGCFWCTEAIFSKLRGVESVESGYSGGTMPNPTYEQVCSGDTQHAEAVKIAYNPNVISYKQLLEIFFTVHDPTTLNRQGADVGTQYRSVIFYQDQKQKETAESVIREVEAEKVWGGRIVTEVVPFTAFYKAEGYHQEYYEKNPRQGYCMVVIAPKVLKFRKKYANLLAEH